MAAVNSPDGNHWPAFSMEDPQVREKVKPCFSDVLGVQPSFPDRGYHHPSQPKHLCPPVHPPEK